MQKRKLKRMKALAGADGDREEAAGAFLAVVRKADDFYEFAESMKAAVRHARWLEEPD